MQVIKTLLLKIIDDIDAGNTNLNEDQCGEVFELLSRITHKDGMMSKYQAYHYLKISRATFDNYVRDGKIPAGRKCQGFTEKFWYKRDLDKFLENK